jgi:hypothetical protein
MTKNPAILIVLVCVVVGVCSSCEEGPLESVYLNHELGFVSGVAFSGDILVAVGEEGLFTFRITGRDPFAIEHLGTVAAEPRSIEIPPDILAEIDASDLPQNIKDAAHEGIIGSPFNDLTVVDSLVYVTIGQRRLPGGELRIYNIADPAVPVLVGSLPVGAPQLELGYVDVEWGEHGAIGVRVDHRDIAYVGAFGGGLLLIDVSDPAQPARIAEFVLEGADDFLCTTVGPHVWWSDITVRTTEQGEQVLAWISYDGAGFHVVDVTDPASPTLLASFDRDHSWYDNGSESDTCDTSGAVASRQDTFFNGVTVSDGVAFVATDWNGWMALDGSDPGSLTLLSHTNPWSAEQAKAVARGDSPWATSPGHGVMTAVQGDLLYVAAGRDGLFVHDVSDPSTPVLLASSGNAVADGKGQAWGLALSDDLVAVGYETGEGIPDSAGGLEIFRFPL